MTLDPSPYLRPLRSDDASAVLAAFASNNDMQRQGDVATLADAERYVSTLLADEAAYKPWAIVVEGRLVGLVCVSVDATNLNGWFWYWMHDDARRRGWASRAAATVANWALGDGGIERLELGHRDNNPESGSVARAAGFLREGTERGKFLIDGERIDVATYGRLQADPWPDTKLLKMYSS